MKAYTALIALVMTLLSPVALAAPAGAGTTATGVGPTAAAVGAVPTAVPAAVPTAVPTAARRKAGAEAISSGGEHSCRLPGDGSLVCWGRNSFGQLGDGKKGTQTPTPQRVTKGNPWRRLSAGGGTTCGIKKNDKLFCWGINHRGQLGDGSTKPRTRPTVVAPSKKWTSVNAGWFNTCGITKQTRLYCWGDNAAGQIGDGSSTKVRTKPTLVKRGKNWTSVSVGSRFVCATKKDGALYCWGGNLFGQLGHGSYAGKSKPARVGTSRNWAEVSTSWTHTCARNTSGGVYCWGRNTFGQVGDGTVTTTPTPRQVIGGLEAVDITTTEGASCAVDDKARVQCWGNNAYGVIGDGSKAFTTSPEPGPVDMREIEGGWRHVCGVTTAGSPYCWGQNDRAQLGNGTLTSSPSPTEVEPLPPADPGGVTDFRIATVNALGNGHTRPYAGDDSYAPSTTRMSWMADQLDNSAVDIMGLQETNADQTAHLVKASRNTWDVYPRPEAGDDAAEAALAWRTSVWELVEATTMMNQFISKELPRPIVKLRHKVTGKEIYVINVHNAPWDYQFKRNKATNVQIAKINELRATGTPVFYVGDMNEKREIL
jgi:alpha-tubulin suppressor-like RCC1 family protein